MGNGPDLQSASAQNASSLVLCHVRSCGALLVGDALLFQALDTGRGLCGGAIGVARSDNVAVGMLVGVFGASNLSGLLLGLHVVFLVLEILVVEHVVAILPSNGPCQRHAHRKRSRRDMAYSPAP